MPPTPWLQHPCILADFAIIKYFEVHIQYICLLPYKNCAVYTILHRKCHFIQKLGLVPPDPPGFDIVVH